MRVSELMSPSTVTIFPEDTVACAAKNSAVTSARRRTGCARRSRRLRQK